MKKILLGSYYQFLSTLKSNAHKTTIKKRKNFFSNMNQNKLYFPIPVSDQQGVKIVSHIAQSMSHDSW
jgi:hypothetical protein